MIDGGDDALGVATFNGGLFDLEAHPFLSSNMVGDRHLEDAIDLISRVDTADGRQFVDYRDLATRHLGTIYEGLLEHHLVEVSAADRAEPSDGFTVDLVNDEGERKESGSYYTPDFVVEYIVRETLEPVIQQALIGCNSDSDKLAAILAINVLDPAMGSGHFLVEAAEFIAQKAVPFDTGVGGEESGDIAEWKRRVAQSCIYGIDRNPLAVELAKLSMWISTAAKDRPLSFLNHHLRPGNSLVGATLAELRSIQGFRRRDKDRTRRHSTQTSLLDDPSFKTQLRAAVAALNEIEQNPAITVAEVKEQERLYDELRQKLIVRYARPLDVVVAMNLGLQVEDVKRGALCQYAAFPESLAFQEFPSLIAQAAEIASENGNFDWELEFPDVFFGPAGDSLGDRAGFDAVIGNPPYLRESGNRSHFEFIQNAEPFRSHYFARTDLYFYFIMQGVWHLRPGGLLGFITPAQWMEAINSENLRRFINAETCLKSFAVVDGAAVFDDAAVDPIIFVCQRRAEPNSTVQAYEARYRFPRHSSQTAVEVLAEPEEIGIPSSVFASANAWYLRPLRGAIDQSICAKVEGAKCKLEDYFHIEAGVNTGADTVSNGIENWPPGARRGDGIFLLSGEEVRALDLPPAEARLLKKYVAPKHVDRYVQSIDEGTRLIYLRGDTDIDQYPMIRAHLSRFRAILSNRAEVLRNSRREWWHLLWPRDQERLESPVKLVIANATAHNAFFLDESATYYNIGCTLLSPNEGVSRQYCFFALALLNSKTYDYYYGLKGQQQGENQRKYFPDRVRSIPIPRSFGALEGSRAAMLTSALEYWRVTGDERTIRAFGKTERAVVLATLAEDMQSYFGALRDAAARFRLEAEGVADGTADVTKLWKGWVPARAGSALNGRRQVAAAALGSRALERIDISRDYHSLSEEQWRALVRYRLGPTTSFAYLVQVWRGASDRVQLLSSVARRTELLIESLVGDIFDLSTEERLEIATR